MKWDAQGKVEFVAELQLVDNTEAAAAHVLPVLASCLSPACVVYPYMSNGALSDRLRRRLGAPPLGYALRLRIALELATALSFLHNQVRSTVRWHVRTSADMQTDACVGFAADGSMRFLMLLLVSGTATGSATISSAHPETPDAC
jgi:hypothetical protein